jgi:hypothetical protein
VISGDTAVNISKIGSFFQLINKATMVF